MVLTMEYENCIDWNNIIGHEDNAVLLKSMLASLKIPHALLFTGPGGVGKALTAKIFAAGILCMAQNETNPETKPCGRCLSCRHYKLGQHPDFKTVRAEDTGSTIKIDQIRELKRFALLSPALSKGRVCVIENAESMTREAANSLLKLLEEPPPNFYFILVAVSSRQLISTITSRCRKIDFLPLPPSVLARSLIEKNFSLSMNAPEKILAAACLSGGRVGKTLEILEPEGFILRDRAAEYIKLLSDGSAAITGEFMESLGSLNKQEALMLLEYAGTIIRDMLILIINSENTISENNCSDNFSNILFNPDLVKPLKNLSQYWDEVSLLAAHKILRETVRFLSGNANIRLAIDALTIKLKRLAERGELAC